MNSIDIELLLDKDIDSFLDMKAGVGHTLSDIRERVRSNSGRSSESSWIGYVVTASFDVFFYYGKTHSQFNDEQGLTIHDIIQSGYFFPESINRSVDSFRTAVRGEGIIDLWMHDQHPLTLEIQEKFLRFTAAIRKSIYEFICRLRVDDLPYC